MLYETQVSKLLMARKKLKIERKSAASKKDKAEIGFFISEIDKMIDAIVDHAVDNVVIDKLLKICKMDVQDE